MHPTRSSRCAWPKPSSAAVRLGLAAVVVAGMLATPAAARERRHCRRCLLILPTLPEPPPIEPPPINPLHDEIPYEGTPREGLPSGTSEPRGGPAASRNPPYSQGFVLTYTIRHDQPAAAAGTLSRYPDVGRALAGCWAASDTDPQAWRDVTLRVSFRRDGSVNGTPRIQHLDAPGDADAQARLRHGFLATLDSCAPLHVSPSLGAAIAGQIFAIRFIQGDS